MGDLDRRNPGEIERTRDLADAVDAIKMADRVHTVAKGDVLNVERVAARIEIRHSPAPHPRTMRAAMRSPVALAAAVMMSRLPEYGGK